MLPLAHSRAWITASTLLVVAVLYLSLAPIVVPMPVPTNFDKVEHALAYAFLAVWFTGLFARGHHWKIVAALAALGLTIEVLQRVMALGRYADPWDMVANLAGIAAGMVLGARTTEAWALKVEAWLNQG